MNCQSNNELEPLIGIDPDQSEKAVIQKSAPLLALWNSPLNLSEFKILDAYLARIDSHQPERRWVRFSKGDLEKLLGIRKINTADLQKRIEHLGVMVKVEDFDEHEGFRSVALFEEAVCIQDQDGIWQVDLKCTPGAMKYIFNIESIGYLRYKLRSVVNINSRYSYLMFLYLERNRFRMEWEVSLENLRNYLGCTNPSYSQFKYFNREVLKRCTQELNEKTSCHFTYTTIKHGNHVRGIHFKLEPLPDDTFYSPPIDLKEEHLSNQSDLLEEADSISGNSSRDFVSMACAPKDSEDPEFSVEEMTQIMAILPMIPLAKMPPIEMVGPAKMDVFFRWHHYLSEKYAELNRICSQKSIRNRFAYLLKMLKKDANIV